MEEVPKFKKVAVYKFKAILALVRLRVFNHWFRCFRTFSSYFAFNIWLGISYLVSAVNFGVFGVKISEGIFGFRPQPNQFFVFAPQRFLPNFVEIG